MYPSVLLYTFRYNSFANYLSFVCLSEKDEKLFKFEVLCGKKNTTNACRQNIVETYYEEIKLIDDCVDKITDIMRENV